MTSSRERYICLLFVFIQIKKRKRKRERCLVRVFNHLLRNPTGHQLNLLLVVALEDFHWDSLDYIQHNQCIGSTVFKISSPSLVEWRFIFEFFISNCLFFESVGIACGRTFILWLSLFTQWTLSTPSNRSYSNWQNWISTSNNYQIK